MLETCGSAEKGKVTRQIFFFVQISYEMLRTKNLMTKKLAQLALAFSFSSRLIYSSKRG
jgi:hypothetical protein